jgi:leucyl aminopeptidase
LKNSENSEERYNRLPFDDYFISKTKWNIADLENLNTGVYAWSTMWAAFLSNFCDNDEKYTHLDIAGPALNSFEPVGYMNKWNTGFWVDSLSTLFQELK